jgi:hypothetical protein
MLDFVGRPQVPIRGEGPCIQTPPVTAAIVKRPAPAACTCRQVACMCQRMAMCGHSPSAYRGLLGLHMRVIRWSTRGGEENVGLHMRALEKKREVSRKRF